MAERLSPTESNILVALAMYKFLTCSQMVNLGIATQRTNISKKLTKLRDRKKALIKRDRFGFHPKKGRLEDIYYLSKYGKQLLMEGLQMDKEDIKAPVGRGLQFSQDYFHRKNTIDCQIALNKTAEQKDIEVVFFERYFDKTGSQKYGGAYAKTKVMLDDDNFIIPDGVFMTREPDGRKRLYCLEMYNGRDTKRVIKQLKKHLKAIELGTPTIKYNFDKAHRVYSVFEFASMKQATINRIKEESLFEDLGKFFYFNDLETIQTGEDFFSGWKSFE